MAEDKRPSVLLVDDIEANLVALRALLEDMNCDLVLARGGDDALRQLLRREFAIMLLDVQMPDMDGYEVAAHARSNPATCEVPIIFLTAAHEGEDLREAAGAAAKGDTLGGLLGTHAGRGLAEPGAAVKVADRGN